MTMTETKLIVLRGPSGSGKSTVAKAVRATQGRTMALVEQDYLRRIVLKEKDVPNGVNIGLIKQTVLFALEHSYDVMLEGIFYAEHYGGMFEEILRAHPEGNHFFYFDIPFEETLRRHQTRPNKDAFGEKQMRAWYRPKDILTCVEERVIEENSTVDETSALILTSCGLFIPNA